MGQRVAAAPIGVGPRGVGGVDLMAVCLRIELLCSSLRSMTESVAHLDVMQIKKIVSQEHYDRALPLAVELISMLTSLCRRFDRDPKHRP